MRLCFICDALTYVRLIKICSTILSSRMILINLTKVADIRSLQAYQNLVISLSKAGHRPVHISEVNEGSRY